MKTLYFTTIVITAFITFIATSYVPHLIMRYRRFKTYKQHKLSRLIRDEVELQLKKVLND